MFIIQIPYGVIYSDQYVVDKLDLNPYLLNEGLRDCVQLKSQKKHFESYLG